MIQPNAGLDFEIMAPPTGGDYGKKWGDSGIWGVIEAYPLNLRHEFVALRGWIHEFITGGYSQALFRQSEIGESFFRKFYTWLSQTEDMETSFIKAGGLTTEIGFHFCQYKVREYYRHHGHPPSTSEGVFVQIRYYCRRGAFLRWGITSWFCFLSKCLSKYGLFDVDRYSFKGKAGLARAQLYIRKAYNNDRDRIRYDDPWAKMISNAVKRGIWREFGIHTWKDFMAELNAIDGGSKQSWRGKSGLERAKLWLISNYSPVRPHFPSKTREYQSIQRAVNVGYWGMLGITSWDDLTWKVLGFTIPKPRCWWGEAGLMAAKQRLQDYYTNHQRLPTCAIFPEIFLACSKKRWTQYGIDSWNDLVYSIFGKVNCTKGLWVGIDGLHRARDLIKKIFQELGVRPNSSHPEIKRFHSALSRGYWTEWGIHSFHDLLKFALGSTAVQK